MAKQADSGTWRSMLENLPEGVVLIRSRDLRVLFANHAAVGMLGFQPQGQRLGGLPVEFRSADGRPLRAGDNPLLIPLRAGRAIQRQELQVAFGDGRVLTLLINSTPLNAVDGRAPGAITVFQDVTHRKELDRERDDFLSIAGHELRTPLASLKGWLQYTQLRASRGQPDDAAVMLTNLNRQVVRIEALIEQLLDTARIERQTMDLEQEEFEITAAVHSAIQTLPPDWATRIIFRRARGMMLRGDKSRIERVVLNLLTNALKYSPPEEPIRVMVLQRGASVMVAVRDYGIGIPEADLPHVFDRFYRAQNSPHSGGLGLGLFIAKEIVQAHGGALEVKSQVGRGTLFAFSLALPDIRTVRETVNVGPHLTAGSEAPA